MDLTANNHGRQKAYYRSQHPRLGRGRSLHVFAGI